MKAIFSTIFFLFMIVKPSAQQTDKIDSLLADYSRPGNPGASLLIAKNNEIILQKNYGLANREEKIPVTPQTNFRLASVTKQFTAASILLLIEGGKLSFDDNLQKIFPEFPEYGKKIKIRNLLNHTSGLIDYEDLIPDTVTIQVMDADVLKMMMGQDTTYFEPGSKYQYSNSAYAVLAMVVEKISAISFPEFLKKNIFDPLGMTTTVAHVEGKDTVANRAYGYTLSGENYVRKDQSITSAVLGDGGIYSNVEDLLKWIKSLETGKLLPMLLIKESVTRGKLNNGDEINYGYGWHLIKFLDYEVIYHTGSTSGFRNIIYRIPDKELVLILLTNRNSGNEKDTRNLAEAVIQEILKK